jgi:hypothetical protein
MERMTFMNKYKCIIEVEIKIMNFSLKICNVGKNQ